MSETVYCTQVEWQEHGEGDRRNPLAQSAARWRAHLSGYLHRCRECGAETRLFSDYYGIVYTAETRCDECGEFALKRLSAE